MKRQHGYTLTEVIVCVMMLGALSAIGYLLYIAFHFINKFW